MAESVDIDRITFVGVGHWTCARDPQNLKYRCWSWRVSIDGVEFAEQEYIETAIGFHGKDGAEALIDRLTPHLPTPIPRELFDFPVHVPGDDTSLELPLSRMRDPEEARAVLQEFFPLVFSRA